MSTETSVPYNLEVPEGKLVIAPLFGPQDSFKRLLERRLNASFPREENALQ